MQLQCPQGSPNLGHFYSPCAALLDCCPKVQLARSCAVTVKACSVSVRKGFALSPSACRVFSAHTNSFGNRPRRLAHCLVLHMKGSEEGTKHLLHTTSSAKVGPFGAGADWRRGRPVPSRTAAAGQCRRPGCTLSGQDGTLVGPGCILLGQGAFCWARVHPGAGPGCTLLGQGCTLLGQGASCWARVYPVGPRVYLADGSRDDHQVLRCHASGGRRLLHAQNPVQDGNHRHSARCASQVQSATQRGMGAADERTLRAHPLRKKRAAQETLARGFPAMGSGRVWIRGPTLRDLSPCCCSPLAPSAERQHWRPHGESSTAAAVAGAKPRSNGKRSGLREKYTSQEWRQRAEVRAWLTSSPEASVGWARRQQHL